MSDSERARALAKALHLGKYHRERPSYYAQILDLIREALRRERQLAFDAAREVCDECRESIDRLRDG